MPPFHVGNFLAFEDPIAHLNNGFGRLADVLLQRQYQYFWQAGACESGAMWTGVCFPAGWMPPEKSQS